MILKVLFYFPNELRFATESICDTFGNWEDKIVDISPLHCAIGDGSIEPSSMSISLSDIDGYFYSIKDSDMAGKKVEILDINNTVIYKGTVERWKFGFETITFELSDLFNLKKDYPLRKLSKKEYPDCNGEGQVIPIIYGHHSATEGAIIAQKAKIDGYLVSENACLEVEKVLDPDENEITTGWWMQNDPDGCWVYFSAGLGTYDYIRVNVKGKAVGNELITDPIDQLSDLLTDILELDTAAFASTQSKMANRRYEGNIAIVKEISIREILDRFSKTFDCEFFIDYNNRLSVDMIDFRELTIEKCFHEKQLIDLEIDVNPATCRNSVKYMYSYIPANDDFLNKPVYESITDYQEGYEPLPLYYTSDFETAFDVAQRFVVKNRAPKKTISITLWLPDFNGLERGKIVDIVPLNDKYGNKYHIRSYDLDFQANTAKISLWSISSLSERLFILGDRDLLPEFWTQANPEQRRYAYVCDRETGRFSDGELGKVLY